MTCAAALRVLFFKMPARVGVFDLIPFRRRNGAPVFVLEGNLSGFVDRVPTPSLSVDVTAVTSTLLAARPVLCHNARLSGR